MAAEPLPARLRVVRASWHVRALGVIVLPLGSATDWFLRWTVRAIEEQERRG